MNTVKLFTWLLGVGGELGGDLGSWVRILSEETWKGMSKWYINEIVIHMFSKVCMLILQTIHPHPPLLPRPPLLPHPPLLPLDCAQVLCNYVMTGRLHSWHVYVHRHIQTLLRPQRHTLIKSGYIYKENYHNNVEKRANLNSDTSLAMVLQVTQYWVLDEMDPLYPISTSLTTINSLFRWSCLMCFNISSVAFRQPLVQKRTLQPGESGQLGPCSAPGKL